MRRLPDARGGEEGVDPDQGAVEVMVQDSMPGVF